MNKKMSGPASSARVLGLSQKQFAAPKMNPISEADLRQCRGGLISIIVM